MKRELCCLCYYQLNAAAGLLCVSKSEELTQHGLHS